VSNSCSVRRALLPSHLPVSAIAVRAAVGVAVPFVRFVALKLLVKADLQRVWLCVRAVLSRCINVDRRRGSIFRARPIRRALRCVRSDSGGSQSGRRWPGASIHFASLMHVWNDCDIGGICPNGSRFAARVRSLGGTIDDVIIDSSGLRVRDPCRRRYPRSRSMSYRTAGPLGHENQLFACAGQRQKYSLRNRDLVIRN